MEPLAGIENINVLLKRKIAHLRYLRLYVFNAAQPVRIIEFRGTKSEIHIIDRCT